MESQNRLGIYINKYTATVVGIHVKGHQRVIQGSFMVTADQDGNEYLSVLAQRIVEGCAEKKLKYNEIAVAVDCSLFMQHQVHSDFIQPKQIGSTIRFDTEEVIATDISTMALAFQIMASNDKGSDLCVFTAQQQDLSDMILALQGRGMDPVYVAPDVSCLGIYIHHYRPASSQSLQGLFGVLSHTHGYFLRGTDTGHVLPVRAFMVGQSKSRTDILSREAFTTVASSAGRAVGTLTVFDAQGAVDTEQLAQRLSLEVTAAEWFQTSGAGPEALARGEDPVEYAVALGAALLYEEKGNAVNFRSDFMPHQGKRLRLHSAIRWAAISVAVLLAALGIRLQLKQMLLKSNVNALEAKLGEDFKIVMGRNMTQGRNPVKELERTLNELKNRNSGKIELDQESVPNRLALVLKAFNNALEQGTDLIIESIDISTKTIGIVGNTPNRSSTLKFYDAIRSNALQIVKDSMDDKGGRSTFRIVVEPVTQADKS